MNLQDLADLEFTAQDFDLMFEALEKNPPKKDFDLTDVFDPKFKNEGIFAFQERLHKRMNEAKIASTGQAEKIRLLQAKLVLLKRKLTGQTATTDAESPA